jgi:hypothetical protein
LGELKEYVGCKIDRDYEGKSMKITQPVLIQSFKDEFDLPGIKHPTPAAHGDQLCKEEDVVMPSKHKEYRTGVGKLLHLMKYSRINCLNRIRELSRYTSVPAASHYDVMKRVMD